MTTKKVPFIKASELIKKVRKDMYSANNKDNYNKYQITAKESDSLCRICIYKAHSLYKNKFGLSKSTERIEKATRLAKRLEREFLRKEEKEKENKPLDGNNFTTIVMIDYSDEQLKKSATENLESLVNGLFEDYTWLRGDIALSHFEAIRKSFSDQFSGFGEETFLEHFNQGEGDYFFKTTFHCTEECETWYEFELIDFKPLERQAK